MTFTEEILLLTRRINSDIFARCALKKPAYARRYALKGFI